jgi:membrane protein YdbS with pleckstrin-like domain
MDTDTDGATTGPWEGSLRPAVRQVGEDASEGGEIDVESLTGPRRTLDPTIQVVRLLQAVVPSLVLGGLVAVAFVFLPFGRPAIGGGVSLVVFGLAALLAVLRYRSWAYEVRADSLYLQRGVITRVSTVVPYVRIQHVDARRGPVERGFGLATTVVYTAGSRGADVSIPGLSPERAADLQARLKQLAIAAEGEDAV